MGNINGEKILEKYNFRSKCIQYIFLAVCFALGVASFLLHLYWAIVIIFAVSIFAIFKANGFLWRKYIANILLEDLDAPLYREVLEAGGFEVNSPLLGMESRFFIGNVEGAISLGEDLLKIESFAKNNARLTLLLLAEYNFIIGDDAALVSACRRFREIPQNNSKKARIQSACIENYEMYLAGDYESLNRPVGKKRKDALYKLIMSYREGRIALARGDKEKARTIFSETAIIGEKTVIGKMSECIIDAIDKGSDYCEPVVLFPNESVNADVLNDDFTEFQKKSRKNLILSLIIVAIALFLYFSGGIFG